MRILVVLAGMIAGLLAATMVYMLPTIITGSHGLGPGVMVALWLAGMLIGPIVAVRRWNLRHQPEPPAPIQKWGR